MAKKAAKQKPWNKMTTAELAAATKQFDKPIRFEDTKPLTPEQQARWEEERRGPSVNILAKSTRKQQVTVKLDAITLRRCRAYAEKHRLSLSEVIDLGLTSVFQFAE